jgi:mannose/fructose-specific phosphotransferase system component IIA
MSGSLAVGIVVVTHGASGADMLDTVTRMLGAAQTEGVSAVDVPTTATREDAMARVSQAVTAADRGAGVVVACDLHGATPTNCAIELMKARHVVVICGVNLAMVVKLASAARTDTTPEAVAQAAVDTAVRSIRVERGRE